MSPRTRRRSRSKRSCRRARWPSATCRSRSETDLADGRARVRFQQSPKMSTYLLFFGLGEFDRATAKLGATELGVVTQKGKADQAQFALDSSVRVLREYNDYFGTPYALPKLDNIASPGSSRFFGAMENWGAIFTFEYAILLDPAISTQADKQGVFGVAAHEIAHQWFGDLVTMRWWDDLWLNEGFASWMASRTTQRLHPRVERDAQRGERARARDGSRLDRDHAPDRAEGRDRRAGGAGVRCDQLLEGRIGHPHARRLRRRRRVARRRAALHESARVRQHGFGRSVARSGSGRGSADHGDRARLHAAARRADDPRRVGYLPRRQDDAAADARRIQQGPAEQEAASVARAGDGEAAGRERRRLVTS